MERRSALRRFFCTHARREVNVTNGFIAIRIQRCLRCGLTWTEALYPLDKERLLRLGTLEERRSR